jgi:AAA domain
VLLIAPAACGKSTMTRRFDSSVYSRVNQDTLRTVDRCIATATQEIKRGRTLTFLPKSLHIIGLLYVTAIGLFCISLFRDRDRNSAYTAHCNPFALTPGLNVVVDNTNIAVESRAHWIALAKREGVQARRFTHISFVMLAERALFSRIPCMSSPPTVTHP